MKTFRIGLVTAFLAAIALWAPGAAVAADSVTVNGQTHALDGTNIYRSTNFLVMYTPAFGASTRTNQYGYEAAVVGGKVTVVQDGVGNMAIPSNGVVLSGHGTSRTWLKTWATVGAPVVLPGDTNPPPPGGTPLLPDLGIRTLRQFTIANPTTGVEAGKKLLKFPGVTSNVGKGAFEIHGTRTSSTSTDWTITQTIYNSDGSTSTVAAPGSTFYYAGDGHNHWHVKDVDSYQLFNAGGTKLREGEKHGFCFEDNTSYRDWPSKGTNGAPANPVYDPTRVCGVNQPLTTTVEQGLSVGWGDTYPSSLPDQAIDITGLPDGTYTVKVTANAAGWFKESNTSNDSATAKISIKGTTVTLISATDGL